MTGPDPIDSVLHALILRSTHAQAIVETTVVQSLWSGYGQIVRFHLEGAAVPSVIVKHVRLPDERNHPYGWSSDHSHQRKLRSYRVECGWYQNYAHLCSDNARVPRSIAVETAGDDLILILEDLDASGYPVRRQQANADELTSCLSWLASFHASFMHERPTHLWDTGTYWHLATRPDEFEALPEGALKSCAHRIDRRLADSSFLTFVHGDAKLANFCFSADGDETAAVDFQYVGGGCGMKDVAYFISSALADAECERMEAPLLDQYFCMLRDELDRLGKTVDFAALEEDWRGLYQVAWADFSRFLHGWRPDHWKIHRYSEHLTTKVLQSMQPPTS